MRLSLFALLLVVVCVVDAGRRRTTPKPSGHSNRRPVSGRTRVRTSVSSSRRPVGTGRPSSRSSGAARRKVADVPRRPGYQKKAGRTSPVSSGVCKVNEWQCNNGQCIPKKYYDDREWYDCDDRSDEPNMNKKEEACSIRNWRCADGECITNSWYNDGTYHDCADGSDEPNVEPKKCKENEWTCNNGECIQKGYHDDGYLDCADCSDEDKSKWDDLCPGHGGGGAGGDVTKPPSPVGECTANQWQCKNGECIKKEYHQDKKYLDCKDCSDEDMSLWDKECPADEGSAGSGGGNKECTSDKWKCANGQCIPKEYHQDGEYLDCDDCSDEATTLWDDKCPSKGGDGNNGNGNNKCSSNEWECNSGQCILKDYHQDGEYLDCEDCSDEKVEIWDEICPASSRFNRRYNANPSRKGKRRSSKRGRTHTNRRQVTAETSALGRSQAFSRMLMVEPIDTSRRPQRQHGGRGIRRKDSRDGGRRRIGGQ